MSRPTLSLCITTRSQAAQVRALLELMRDHVDEIVLSVDAQGDLEALDACAELADRRFVHELDRNPNWLAAWVMSECAGDWILRLDDDEVPSAALLAALPELIGDRYPTAYRIPRRWLVAPDRYVSGFPWRLESLVRLVRNVPSLWHTEGGIHSETFVEGEVRLLDAPMYHLDTVLQPVDERRAKVRRYAELGAPPVLEGVDINRFYVPEEWDDLETAAVPPEDRASIQALLDPSPVSPTARQAKEEIERVGLERAGRFNRVPLRGGDAEGSIRVVTPRERLPASSRRHFEIEVANDGETSWWRTLPWQRSSVAVLWRWLDGDGREIAPRGGSPIPETVPPGGRRRFWIAPEAPATEGPCTLELRLAAGAEERVGEAVRVAVEIGPADPGPPDTLDPLTLRERAIVERAQAAEVQLEAIHDFKRTRRYRMAAAFGRLIDGVRSALDRGSRR